MDQCLFGSLECSKDSWTCTVRFMLSRQLSGEAEGLTMEIEGKKEKHYKWSQGVSTKQINP